MYLVVDSETGTYVFSEQDPRESGYEGEVIEGVEARHTGFPGRWTPGAMQSDLFLGRSRTSEREYQVFNSINDCSLAGYEPLGSNFRFVHDWTQYTKGP